MTDQARFLFCQYADDVREEIGGKLSLIGVYQGGMKFHGPVPAKLAKLAVIATISAPSTEPFKKLGFVIRWNDAVRERTPIVDVPQNLTPPGGSDRLWAQVVVIMPQFEIDGPGKVSVSAIVDDVELAGNPLPVEVDATPKKAG